MITNSKHAFVLKNKYVITNENIIDLIATLSTGYDYKCCTNIDGNKCINIISISNKFDNKGIYKYLMNKQYVKLHDHLSNYESRINLNGELMRIFYGECELTINLILY